MNAETAQEVADARNAAVDYNPYEFQNPIRQLVTSATTQAYKGSRSVESYLDLMAALITDDTNVFKDNNIDIRMLFINSLKSRDTHLESMVELSKDGEQIEGIDTFKQNLTSIVRGAADRNILDKEDFLIHLSSQLLEDAKIIPNKAAFDRKLVRVNTSMLYKQTKFNLLHESNEGYAALTDSIIQVSIDLECNKDGQAPGTPLDRIPQLLWAITTYTAAFDLDPNKVLDILLGLYIREVDKNHKFWIGLLQQSPWIEPLALSDNVEGGSAVMAHLMGFRFMQLQTGEEKNTPKEIYYACALLVKNGLIRLCNLIPYLRPYDEAMAKKKSEYMEHMQKEIKSNTGGLLAMFGALGEDGTTEKLERPKPKVTEDEGTDGGAYTANDIVELTRALISVGDVHHAGLMFAEYDKLIDIYPELAHNIYRLCDVMLDDVYDKYVPDEIRNKYKSFKERERQRNSEIKMHDILVLDSLKDDTHDLKKKEHYLFFYRNWKLDLPKVESFEDLVNVFLPVMRMAGHKTYLAPNLIARLSLITRSLIERDQEFVGCRPYCMAMIREIILPAVSYSNYNPGTTATVWELLALLSFQERYALYGEWSDVFYKKSKESELLKHRTERAAKSIMQRMSKNDIRQHGRDLGKLANSNPAIVFNYMLDHIQSLDNMAPYMADACRYMSDLALDVLGYLMAEKWTGYQKGKNKKIKMKEDMMPSTWLRALSVFSGMLYKKQDIEPTPLLRYMILRLHYDDAVDDLILFNEFITKMCGIEIMGSAMTDDQIMSASSSETLKAEASQSVLPDNRRASTHTITRLKEALRDDDTALQLIVLLYRLREACLGQDTATTSTLGPRLDYVHQTINQYLEMLTTIFKPAEYARLIPDITTLCSTYGLPEYLAMQLTRPKTQHALRTYKAESPETPSPDEPHPVFRPLVQEIPCIVSNSTIFRNITPEFYTMFWQLSLYDIHVPDAHYQAAIRRHSDVIDQCRDTRSSFYLNNRPSVVAKAKRHAQDSQDRLKEDFPRHKADVEKTMQILRASQSRWFPLGADRVSLISDLIQHCLLPRSVLSEVDAVFCYEFVMLMHRLNVHNFSSLTLFDKVLSDSLPTALISFTEYETTIHARFLYRIFAKMSEWHKNEALYVKEAHGDGLIGFQKEWNAQTPGREVPEEDLLSFADFRRVMHKWNLKITVWIEQALQSGEPHEIRNAFLILRQFIHHFPAIRDHGQVAVKATQILANRKHKDVVKVLARSYLGLIEKHKSRWITKNAFMGIEEPEPEKTQDDGHAPTSERKRPCNDPENPSPAKRSRHHDGEKATEPKREAEKRTSEGVRDSTNESTPRNGSRPASSREPRREAHTRETSTREQQPRARNHILEAIREAEQRSTRKKTREEPGCESARESNRLSAKESSRDLRPSCGKSGRDHHCATTSHNDTTTAPTSTNNNGSSATPQPRTPSSSRKRERIDDEAAKERARKRYREDRDRKEEERERERRRRGWRNNWLRRP